MLVLEYWIETEDGADMERVWRHVAFEKFCEGYPVSIEVCSGHVRLYSKWVKLWPEQPAEEAFRAAEEAALSAGRRMLEDTNDE